jgi:hypothetical protein
MRRNKAMKKTFEPVCQEFGDNFVNDIAKTSRAELMDRRSPWHFRDENNESMVVLLL